MLSLEERDAIVSAVWPTALRLDWRMTLGSLVKNVEEGHKTPWLSSDEIQLVRVEIEKRRSSLPPVSAASVTDLPGVPILSGRTGGSPS
jgi:hypothetical protein